MTDITFTTFRGSDDGSIVQSSTTRPALQGTDVLVSIRASGLCGGDQLFKRKDMVLGHEGAGVVLSVGPAVTLYKPGDRVGWGFLQGSCGHCHSCHDGWETYCPDRKMYGHADLDQGSMAYGIVKPQERLYALPQEIADEEVAPLMCAGSTVWAALEKAGAKAPQRVGVVGIGGLGHLAIQFAAKMGLSVVAFTSSSSKLDDCLSLGATSSHLLSDVLTPGFASKFGVPLDILLIACPTPPFAGQGGYAPFLSLLSPRATLVPLTIAPIDFTLPQMALVMQGLTIQGSVVASRGAIKRMLGFAARSGVRPWIKKYDMDREGVEKAFSDLKAGEVRYRGVLVVPADKRLV